MKIVTITCHEVYNHGASLQEYALLKFLNEQGHQAEVIHYKPPYLTKNFKLAAAGNPRFDKPIIKYLYLLAKLPERFNNLKRKRSFDSFSEKHIPTGKTLYTNNEELKQNIPNADAYICGSDQIWNSYFENGKDPAFYLNFVPDDKLKIAYAASFAIDSIVESLKPFVKENVARLDAVGVRETSGVTILNDLGIDNAVQVLDPVFLVEVAKWKEFVSQIEDDFIFVYDFDSNPVIKEIALDLKKKNGWKIYTVNQNIAYADKNFYLEGPENYLSLMYYAKFIATNSFHSVAFSIIFEKQIVVVNRSEAINTRMRDLLSLFGIVNQLITNIKDYQKLAPIDYNNIHPLKEKHIENSKNFLHKALLK
jgi:hypothetical protein